MIIAIIFSSISCIISLIVICDNFKTKKMIGDLEEELRDLEDNVLL